MKPNLFYGPWTGYMSSVARHRVPRDKLVTGSFDWQLDPQERKWFRRKGTLNVGGTTGILIGMNGATDTDVMAEQLFELTSPTITDTYPTHGVLFSGVPAVDLVAGTPHGVVYFRNTNGAGTNEFIGQNSTYPTDLKCPTLALNDPVALTDVFYRLDGTRGWLNHAHGSRRLISINGRLYMPNYLATPSKWNQTYNVPSGTGQKERIFPTGHIPPLWAPTIATSGAQVTDGSGSWDGDDTFYHAVVFRFSDGSRSKPFIPRAPNANLTGGLGVVNPLVSGGSGQKFRAIEATDIPRGQDGCVARELYRTPKLSKSLPLNPLDLRLWEIIENNTATSVISTKGNDDELVSSPLYIPQDSGGNTNPEVHIWPPRARYIWAGDHRLWVMYCQRNPSAIILCPHKEETTGTSLNGDDDTLPAATYQYKTIGAVLHLTNDNFVTSTTISIASTNTLQDVVDLINATTSSSNAGQWAAQLAPGADATAPANRIVVIDGSTADKTAQRAFHNAYPGILFLDSTYFSKFPAQKRQVWFTMADPGMPPHAADSYSARNLLTGPEEWGIGMGGAPLLDGQIACFSKAIAVIRNIRGGKSGEDAHYRMEPLNQRRGCIAPQSIVAGDGWVGYLTAEGYVVTDGQQEVVISGEVWNPVTDVGDWSYEIQQCMAGAAKDDRSARFYAAILGTQLHVTFRSSASVAYPDRRMVYDFGASAGASGLAEVLQPDGTPWPWSTLMKQRLSAMGQVRKSAGFNRYGSVDENTGTYDGRVDQFDTGNDDNGTAIAPVGYCPTDFNGTSNRKSLQNARIYYKANTTGLSLTISRDQLRASEISIALAASGASDIFTRKTITPRQALRSPAHVLNFGFKDTGTGATKEVQSIEAEVVELDSPV